VLYRETNWAVCKGGGGDEGYHEDQNEQIA